MPSVQKHGDGWRAQVAVAGVRRSKVFKLKRDALDWATNEELAIKTGRGRYGTGTLGDLMQRYARDVSPHKRGARWEQIRLEALQRDPLASVQVKDAKPADFAEWRDRRLRQVSASSVHREMVLLSAVMTAGEEWGMFPVSPIRGVRKPKVAPPRDRLVTDDEITRLVAAVRGPAEAEAVRAFRVCCMTGMRAGEVLAAKRDGQLAHVPMTKAGVPRVVPMSPEAAALFGDGFRISAAVLDMSFRRVRNRAGIVGLTFHDSRHRAITDLSRVLDPLALARVVGHRKLDQLMTYYAEGPEALAARLSQT